MLQWLKLFDDMLVFFFFFYLVIASFNPVTMSNGCNYGCVHGTCNNQTGSCNCNAGYTGVTCSQGLSLSSSDESCFFFVAFLFFFCCFFVLCFVLCLFFLSLESIWWLLFIFLVFSIYYAVFIIYLYFILDILYFIWDESVVLYQIIPDPRLTYYFQRQKHTSCRHNFVTILLVLMDH